MSRKLRVGFGKRPVFNKAVDEYIDAEKFEHQIVDINQTFDFNHLDLVVPLTISQVQCLARHHQAMNHKKFIVAAPRATRLAHDKNRFNEFLKQNEFGHLLPRVSDKSAFPFVLKRSQDAGGKNTLLVRNESDLERWQHLLQQPDYFCQQYVPGDIEYTTHFIYSKGIRYSCTIKFRMNRDYYIRGVRMQPFKNVQMSIVDPIFDATFAEILSALEFEGVGCFNFKIIDEQPVIFEMNPRYGGSLSRDINNFLSALNSTLR